jgi:hypothetical protein
MVDFEGIPVPFLSKQDLITAKRAAGRPQDPGITEQSE